MSQDIIKDFQRVSPELVAQATGFQAAILADVAGRRGAMHGRIHGFNVTVAHVWAEQEHLLEKAGQPMPVEDGYIAATARRHGLTIVTGNDKDFRRPGLKVFNPFKEAEPAE
mgnify:CR=1 FL=1